MPRHLLKQPPRRRSPRTAAGAACLSSSVLSNHLFRISRQKQTRLVVIGWLP